MCQYPTLGSSSAVWCKKLKVKSFHYSTKLNHVLYFMQATAGIQNVNVENFQHLNLVLLFVLCSYSMNTLYEYHIEYPSKFIAQLSLFTSRFITITGPLSTALLCWLVLLAFSLPPNDQLFNKFIVGPLVFGSC